MAGEQQRHDISDKAWERIRPYTIGEKGTRGGNARDTRQFINGVFWILRTGAPWRDLPETYGNWKNVHRRFCRWRDKGIWERILEALVDDTADDRCQPCQSTPTPRLLDGGRFRIRFCFVKHAASAGPTPHHPNNRRKSSGNARYARKG